jgi:hypothetical protein
MVVSRWKFIAALLLTTFITCCGLLGGVKAAISCAVPGQGGKHGAHTKALNFCEIVSHPDLYHRRKVLVKAIYRGGGGAGLYDPDCNGGHGWMDVEFAGSLKSSRLGKLNNLLKRDGRAYVVFEGTFYGPEPVEVDPKLPEWLKEKSKGAMRRYGHLGMFETMIEVTAVERVEAVPGTIPW